MKSTRLQFEYRDSASALHRKVGDTLRASELFSGYEIYQEYPVDRVNPNYSVSSHHFDWVIPHLFLVIECHGKQHYEVTDFSGKAEDRGIGAFHDLRRRDNSKKEAALEAGFTYLEIPYTDEGRITDEYIWQLFEANRNDSSPVREEPDNHPAQDTPKYRKLLWQRLVRKEQYARAKARKLELESRRAAESALSSEGTGEDDSSGTR